MKPRRLKPSLDVNARSPVEDLLPHEREERLVRGGFDRTIGTMKGLLVTSISPHPGKAQTTSTPTMSRRAAPRPSAEVAVCWGRNAVEILPAHAGQPVIRLRQLLRFAVYEPIEFPSAEGRAMNRDGADLLAGVAGAKAATEG